jgi:hypothetical protein
MERRTETDPELALLRRWRASASSRDVEHAELLAKTATKVRQEYEAMTRAPGAAIVQTLDDVIDARRRRAV